MRWKDTRLAHTGSGAVHYPLDQVWNPRVVIVDEANEDLQSEVAALKKEKVSEKHGLNEDAAFDDNGVLRALPAWGAGVGYTHQGADKSRSTVSYGYANVDTEKSNGAFAFDHSNYVSANLIYLWSLSFRLGFEYLYGTNEVRNNASHNGQRLNFVLKYDLVK